MTAPAGRELGEPPAGRPHRPGAAGPAQRRLCPV